MGDREEEEKEGKEPQKQQGHLVKRQNVAVIISPLNLAKLASAHGEIGTSGKGTEGPGLNFQPEGHAGPKQAARNWEGALLQTQLPLLGAHQGSRVSSACLPSTLALAPRFKAAG